MESFNVLNGKNLKAEGFLQWCSHWYVTHFPVNSPIHTRIKPSRLKRNIKNSRRMVEKIFNITQGGCKRVMGEKDHIVYMYETIRNKKMPPLQSNPRLWPPQKGRGLDPSQGHSEELHLRNIPLPFNTALGCRMSLWRIFKIQMVALPSTNTIYTFYIILIGFVLMELIIHDHFDK